MAKTANKTRGAIASTLARGSYKRLKWVFIALIALSMAEFLAFDMAMIVAADAVFYLELLVAGWAMSALALLNPAIGYKMILIGSRIFQAPFERGHGSADDEEPSA